MSDALAKDCLLAAQIMADLSTFETGQGILREAAAEITRLRAANEQLGRDLNCAKYGQPDFAWSLHLDVVARLKEALLDIADPKRLTSHGDPVVLRDRARAALTAYKLSIV